MVSIANQTMKGYLDNLDESTKKEFIQFKGHETSLNGWIIKPANFDETKKYPVRKPVVMAALYIGQEQNGYISFEVMKEVAGVLGMTAEEVMGVVTFYTMYHQKQMGKYHIQVCTNVQQL